MTIRAFLFDQDETLTKPPSIHIYTDGIYAHMVDILTREGRADEIMPHADYRVLHHEMQESGQCAPTQVAARFGFDATSFYTGMGRYMDQAGILHDTASADALNKVADRALIFTDAPLDWARARAAQIGHRLRIMARDDELPAEHAHEYFHRKGYGAARWHLAVDKLSAMIGAKLQPANILMIDDSLPVLRQAKSLGFKTGLCTWARTPRQDPVVDYDVPHVGTFLQRLGNL